ncbi:hypothetical protein NLJ89_g8402 [Agrocybe chaxingu]|uniref:F-box domain-containing protein n=1 Tax=Agrocybe chaxingu TaxID=84603 RepID=A0A9W8JVE7_9AGAR|nr:hypothetical protein NLJ89_g8402 [Agrocybe chaxingu]
MESQDAPFSSKFNTNYTPTDDEVCQIKDILSAPLATVHRLEEEKVNIRRQIKRLQKDYDALNEESSAILSKPRVAAYQALLAPMRRLPPEVLQEIFIFSIPATSYALMTRHDTPVSLTQVCQLWRQVAIATPAVWSSIHIPIHYPSERSSINAAKETLELRLRVVQEWLCRSRAHTLRISIFDPHPRHYNELEEARGKLFDALFEVSKRWGKVKVETTPQVLQRFAQELSSEDVPLLESFEVKTCLTRRQARDPLIIWGASKLLAAPKLRQFTTNTISESVRDFELPFKQLTRLELGHGLHEDKIPFISLSRLAWMLMPMKSLVHGAFVVSQAAFEFPKVPIRLPALEYLEIVEHGVDVNMSELFQRLLLRRLKHLKYLACRLSRHQSPHPLPLLLGVAGAGATLQILEVDGKMFYSKDSILECLRCAPNLHSLSFVNSTKGKPIMDLYLAEYFDDTLLDALISSETTGAQFLLPKLKNLIIQIPANFTQNVISEFLGFRSGNIDGVPVVKLERFSIVLYDKRPLDGGIDRMRAYPIDEGLKLEIEYLYVTDNEAIVFRADEGLEDSEMAT